MNVLSALVLASALTEGKMTREQRSKVFVNSLVLLGLVTLIREVKSTDS